MENANKNEETIETAATVTVVAVDDADQTSTTTAEIQTNEVKKNKKHKKKSKKSKNTEVVNVETKVQALTETTKNLTISDQTANNSTLTSTSNAEQTTSTTTTTTTATAANNNSNYDNLQKAVQILGNAKAKDEAKQFDAALKLYRQGVDMLLEELIERQGTNESRTYLRNKCNDFMNRIDQIKLLLEIEAKTKLKENLEKNEKQISV